MIRLAIQRERISRFKHHGSLHDKVLGGRFPRSRDDQLIDYCLDAAGLGRSGVQVVWGQRGLHHLYHALSAFIPGPFEEAAVLVLDGRGSSRDEVEPGGAWWEAEHQSVYVGRGDRLTLVDKRFAPVPVSTGLGGLYHEVSNYLFGEEVWPVNQHWEGKTMGLAPYGTPAPDRFPMIELGPQGTVTCSRAWRAAVTGKHGRWEDDFQQSADLAATVQAALEEGLLHIARWIHETTGMRRLCYAGGVALNGVANHRLLREGPFEELWIPPYCHDGGQSVGIALHAHLEAGGARAAWTLDHDYLGRTYSDAAIERALAETPGLRYRRLPDDERLCRETAEALAAGKIVAWFQGGSEFGPRSRGHRSILCDPRRADMKDVLNRRVKAREWFRPFAPSVLVEDASRYFDLGVPSPFMLLVAPVRSEFRHILPAITHVDGTARLQTVDDREGDLYPRLIRAFRDTTGIGVLLNTSFNKRGPIVETPEDAVEVFLSADMDVLCLGRFMAERVQAGSIELYAPRLADDLIVEVTCEVLPGVGFRRHRPRAFLGRSLRLKMWQWSDHLLDVVARCDGRRTVREIQADLGGEDVVSWSDLVAALQRLESQGALRFVRPPAPPAAISPAAAEPARTPAAPA